MKGLWIKTLIAVSPLALLFISCNSDANEDMLTETYYYPYPLRPNYFIKGNGSTIYWCDYCQIKIIYSVIFSRKWIIHKDYKITLMSDRVYHTYYDFWYAVVTGKQRLDLDEINKELFKKDSIIVYYDDFEIDKEIKNYYLKYGAKGLLDKFTFSDSNNIYLNVVEKANRYNKAMTVAYYLWKNGYNYFERNHDFSKRRFDFSQYKEEILQENPLYPSLLWFFTY